MEQLSIYLTSFLLILFCTAFVKITTVLSIFRYGLGLNSFPFGLVILALSLVLSLLVVEPQLNNSGGLSALVSNKNLKIEQVDRQFRPFLKNHTDQRIIDRLEEITQKESATEETTTTEEPSFNFLLSAFMISELQAAFIAGVVIIIPFLVIDLLVVNILMALNIVQLSATLVSLPFKILLFFVVDGWLLLTEKLLGGYFS